MNLISSTFILFITAFFAFPGSALAQNGKITEAQFWRAVATAYTSTHRAFPRTDEVVYERLYNGKVTYSRTERTEYEAVDRFRLIKETNDGGKKSVREMIQIGTARYCKGGEGEWKIGGCYIDPPARLETAVESRFSQHDDKDGITYNRTTKFLSPIVIPGQSGNLVSEDILKLNPNGTTRDRTITTSIQETKVITARETQHYQYGVTLKPIEAPIK